MACEEEAGLQPSVGVGVGSKVKRRPLPNNPTGGPEAVLEPAIPVPGRAKHGPRDYRANSMPPEVSFQHHQLHSLYGNQPIQHTVSQGSSPQLPAQDAPRAKYHDEPKPPPEQAQYEEPYAQPEILPQLPPSSRHRTPSQQRLASGRPQPPPLAPRAQTHLGIQHSHSAPIVPQYHQEPEFYRESHELRTDYPEPIPDLDFQHRQVLQRRHDVPPGWQEEYGDPYAHVESPIEEESLAPPLPPVHTVSAPAVPRFAPSPTARYGSAPPSSRHHSVPSVSPQPGIERGYGSAHHTPTRGHPPRGGSVDHYAPSPESSPYGNTPPSLLPGQQPPPYARAPAARVPSIRQSVTDPYVNTPMRPHPLSQEVPRARSPLPDTTQQPNPRSYQEAYRPREVPPLNHQRAVSPQPPGPQSLPASRSRSSYNLRHPVRGFESSDNSPLSTSRPFSRLGQAADYSPTARTSISPLPSPNEASSLGVPFGPDSFDIHNPQARPTQLANTPHAPYQVQSGAEIGRGDAGGPIVGWHGQEIDPSDHLPVDSWAPEPEKKIPNKSHGAGRDRDFGPRAAAAAARPGTSNGDYDNYDSIANPYAQQEYSRGNSPYSAPHVPPKVPLQQKYAHEALSREISNIDIGSSSRYGRPGGNGSVPAPTAYVPVRTHRDRSSYSFL